MRFKIDRLFNLLLLLRLELVSSVVVDEFRLVLGIDRLVVGSERLVLPELLYP